MKRLLLCSILAASLIGSAGSALAHDAYDDSESHPLRLAAYPVHAAGWLIEWLLMRPHHFLVSHPQLEPITGHVPHEDPFGDYGAYEPEHQ